MNLINYTREEDLTTKKISVGNILSPSDLLEIRGGEEDQLGSETSPE